MEYPDMERFRAPKADSLLKSNRPPRHRRDEWFLKGPIPGEWLGRAANLPGRALHVALAVWHLAAMTKGKKVIITTRIANRFGVCRHSLHRWLSRLESVRLVTVERKRGRSPVVSILPAYGPESNSVGTGIMANKEEATRRAVD